MSFRTAFQLNVFFNTLMLGKVFATLTRERERERACVDSHKKEQKVGEEGGRHSTAKGVWFPFLKLPLKIMYAFCLSCPSATFSPARLFCAT